MSRTKKMAINSVVGLICTILNNLLSFVLQAVFIRLLGIEYAGINDLFTSVLSVLNLAEVGFGNAITFRLYKSIADKDDEKTRLYLASYRKICYGLAAFIFAAGMCCIPFLDKLVTSEKTFSEPLWSLFVIVIATSSASHIFDFRKSLIDAKQDKYINIIIGNGCLFACHGLQILGLVVYKNIYLYLSIKLFTTLVSGVISGIVSKKKYGIDWKSEDKLSKEEMKTFSKDVGSLAFYKFCRTMDAQIDTFLISKFVDIVTTGIYGRINMLFQAINDILGNFNDGMTAGIGDLYASETDKKRVEKIFYQSMHFTFFLYGVCIAVLTPFVSPFMKWWINYTLDSKCIYVMIVNFFIYGMGMNVATFRNSMGLFVKGWKRPAFTALANLVFSIVLTKRLGLIGTLLGTLIARMITQVWYDPYLICKYGLNAKPYKYYFRYVFYAGLIFIASFGMLQLSNILPPMDSFVSLLWHGILFAFCSVVFFFAVGFVFPEQKDVLNKIFGLFKPVFDRIMRKEKSNG